MKVSGRTRRCKGMGSCCFLMGISMTERFLMTIGMGKGCGVMIRAMCIQGSGIWTRGMGLGSCLTQIQGYRGRLSMIKGC